MPSALLITAVDTVNDKLTSVAHGLNTGDGYIQVYTPDPAPLGGIPGGLASVTYYWAIKVDNDNVKLASSSANAFANIAIDITSVGSGALYLMRGLPFGVPRLSAPGVEVFSDDLNKDWGAIVDLWRMFTAQAQSTFTLGLALESTAEALTRPILAFRDYKGHARTHIDHNGMRGGQVSEWEEHWKGAAMSTDWTFTSGGGSGSAAPTDPISGFNQRGLLFTTGTAGGTPPWVRSQFLTYVYNDSLVTLEGIVRTPAALQTGGSSDNILLALFFNNGGAPNVHFDFYYSSASANWRCRWVSAGGVVTTNTDSGVAVVANTNYRFKLELAGSNNTSQAANTMQARYFINGALVATTNVAAWAADKAMIHLGMNPSGVAPTESYAWTFGRIRLSWPHLLSGDAV